LNFMRGSRKLVAEWPGDRRTTRVERELENTRKQNKYILITENCRRFARRGHWGRVAYVTQDKEGDDINVRSRMKYRVVIRRFGIITAVAAELSMLLRLPSYVHRIPKPLSTEHRWNASNTRFKLYIATVLETRPHWASIVATTGYAAMFRD